ncbi:mucoidy inhibitor MuiA family protein [Actinokineospora spheciospongiae]|uniref:mucoidy inhibitor MuiA family protein n=1 Tax=Actinokineospora spheciospongiae TaxID=909613 RepID=UPI0005569C48|nr:mucoidy inhibitor MuiA family protein [Actinokineospora spheciospongiae]
METRVEAPIVAVTVYPGQARVTRRGRVAVEPGEHRARVGGLPLGLHPDSVRVSGRGPATVLGVDVRHEHNARTPDGALAELEAGRDALRARLHELGDQDTVLGARVDLLTALGTRTGSTFAQALAKGETEPARVAEVGDALAGQLTAVLRERRALTETRQRVQAEHDEAQRRIADRGRERAPDRRVVEVELGADQAGEVELEVSYLVDAAGWESRYDVRLTGGTLRLTWYGLVTQHSGEDWPECELRLSTARPATTVEVPELAPWYLDVPRPPAPRMAAQANYGAAMPMAAAPGGAVPAPKAMTEAVAAVEHSTASTTYRPSRPVAVPSDGGAHRTTVAAVDLPAAVDHVTVPLRGPEAYLRATVVNTSEHALRPGRASIFHDSEFVGVTDLAPWAPGEEIELTLGIDDRVRVERELVRRAAGKAVMGGTRRQEVSYRIRVGNYGPHPARVTVIDQLPVSRVESAVVRDVALHPQPAETTELGEVTWRMELPPGQTGEISFGFRVDIAKGVTITGWRD